MAPAPNRPPVLQLLATIKSVLVEILDILKALAPVLEEMRAQKTATSLGYKTDATVKIQSRAVLIAGVLVPLNTRETIFLVLLAQHAKRAGNGGPPFISRPDLLERIEATYASFWPYSVRDDLDRVVHSLHKKLASKTYPGLTPDLIESVRHVGVRLSTPPHRIEILREALKDSDPG